MLMDYLAPNISIRKAPKRGIFNNLIEKYFNLKGLIKMININRVGTPTITLAQLNLLFRLRSLWRELATWMRAYLVSRFVMGGYSEEAFARLYLIPEKFGSLMSTLFGTNIGNQYAQLLSNQVIAIRDYIEALISGDVNAANEHYRRLYQYGDERAKFLAAINPFWDENQLRNLIYRFLNLTIEEIGAFITNDYKTSIDVFDTLLTHTDNIGDYFAEGLYNYIISRGGTAQPAQPAPTPPASGLSRRTVYKTE